MMPPARRRFPGEPDQVAKARRFVRTHSGLCPVLDEAVLLTSELCTNAVRHSVSGQGGFFEVAVQRGPGSLRIEVRDDGSERAPVVRDFDELAESGRGLEIVGLVAARWGQASDEFGHLVFFELSWPAAAQDPEARPARVSRFAHPIQQAPRSHAAIAAPRDDKRANRLVSPQEWSVVLDGEKLRTLRHERGLSQERLCWDAGVSVDTVARLEREGRRVCRGRTAGRLAGALGVTPETLLAEEQAGCSTPSAGSEGVKPA